MTSIFIPRFEKYEYPSDENYRQTAKKEIKADCLGVNSVSMCGIIGMGPIQLSMIINDDDPVDPPK